MRKSVKVFLSPVVAALFVSGLAACNSKHHDHAKARDSVTVAARGVEDADKNAKYKNSANAAFDKKYEDADRMHKSTIKPCGYYNSSCYCSKVGASAGASASSAALRSQHSAGAGADMMFLNNQQRDFLKNPDGRKLNNQNRQYINGSGMQGNINTQNRSNLKNIEAGDQMLNNQQQNLTKELKN